MIYYLKRSQIDIVKYDGCIENALNSRIYAFSWYLDCVADNWDALILNDYEAVMPLPWRQKYFIKYIYPPAWTQQLGVFSDKEISESLVWDFIKAIPKKFKKITIQFKAGNSLSGKNVTERVNYILPLDKPYEELFKGYRKDRREKIKKNSASNSIKEDGLGLTSIIEIFKKNYVTKISIASSDFLKLKLLIQKIRDSEKARVKIVVDENQTIVNAGALFLIFKRQLYYLFSSQNDVGKKANSLSSILDEVIKSNSNSAKILDFEGSMIPGIADFFKSFGAQKEVYYVYQKLNF